MMIDTEARFSAIRDDFDEAAKVIRSALQHIEETTTDPDIRVLLFNNTIVSVTATVEETIRALLAEYLKILREEYTDYRKLRKVLQKSNIDVSIDALRRLKEPGYELKAAGIAANIEKCLLGHHDYYLHIERLTHNSANFKSEELTNVVKRAGLESPWKTICSDIVFEEWTGVENIDTRTNLVIIEWNGIFEERDIVVHRVSQATGWSAHKIRTGLDLCVLVIHRLCTWLRDDAHSLIEKSAREVRS